MRRDTRIVDSGRIYSGTSAPELETPINIGRVASSPLIPTILYCPPAIITCTFALGMHDFLYANIMAEYLKKFCPGSSFDLFRISGYVLSLSMLHRAAPPWAPLRQQQSRRSAVESEAVLRRP